jgi:hypothetical protein
VIEESLEILKDVQPNTIPSLMSNFYGVLWYLNWKYNPEDRKKHALIKELIGKMKSMFSL